MTIRIILATDDRFAMACGVTMHSVLTTTRSRIRFALFQSGVSTENLRRLRQIAACHSGCELEVIDADAVLRSLPMPARSESYSRMIYARLVAPDLLSESRALYLDTDTLVLENVANLFHAELQGLPLGAIRDYGAECRCFRDPNERAYFHGILDGRPYGDYFNTGVLVMDLDAFRRERLGQRAIEYIQQRPDLDFPDQDALNATLDGAVNFLPERWNTMVMERRVAVDPFVPKITRQRVKAAFQNPAILHYAGAKPWTPSPVHRRRNFFNALRQTPWRNFQISTSGLDWKEKRKLLKLWRGELVRVQLQLMGRPIVHWGRAA